MIKEREKHIIIIGAGFAGLWAVKTLSGKENMRVTLIDRNNYHTFLPLLYQVGAAEVEPEQIAYPVRSLLRRRNSVSYLRAEATAIDYAKKHVVCNDQRIGFDYCIIATGSRTDYFSVAGADRYAFPLKTLDDAIIVRNHILSCFERAAYLEDRELRKRLLTFVVVGGGPTGVEFSGALSELVRGPLKKDFSARYIKDVSIVLVESVDRLLPMLSPSLGNYTAARLKKMGITVRLKSRVKEITGKGIRFTDGTLVETETAIWTAGVSGEMPASDTGVPISSNRRIRALPTLQVPGHPDIYVTGDLAYIEEKGAPLPMTAPVAIQQGKQAALNILSQMRGMEPAAFVFRDKGAMVTIGRNAAVTRIGAREFKGFIAWIIWIVVHILNLIGFRNKMFVLIHWIWDYLFFERSVRLILPGCCDNPNGKTCIHRCR